MNQQKINKIIGVDEIRTITFLSPVLLPGAIFPMMWFMDQSNEPLAEVLRLLTVMYFVMYLLLVLFACIQHRRAVELEELKSIMYKEMAAQAYGSAVSPIDLNVSLKDIAKSVYRP